ncbi:MAG: polysaccharide deacetylase [Clostridiales bacterium]|nr:polysaccharide deacetylase [Clostridiales bacterium]
MKSKNERYFGSVRFFKNLILLAVIIMILIPVIVSFNLKGDLKDTKSELETTNQELMALEERTSNYCDFKAESPYAELYPEFYAPEGTIAGVKHENTIYLTFDDGPSDRTVEVLDILKEKDVKATFFVVGNEIPGNEDILRRMADEGHTIAMHTDTHNYVKIYASVDAFLADMYGVYSRIEEATGIKPSVFRFPGGSINNYNSGIYQELTSEMLRRGFVPFDWNISSQDAALGGPLPVSTITSNIINGAGNVSSGVVLMHDSHSKTTTVEALGPVIDELKAMGFEFGTLSPEVQSVLFAYGN